MDTLKGAFDLCRTIHDMHGTYTSNQKTCDWLTDKVKNIERTLEQQLARNAVPLDLNDNLLSLLEVHTPPAPPFHPPRNTHVTALHIVQQTATGLPVTHLTGPESLPHRAHQLRVCEHA